MGYYTTYALTVKEGDPYLIADFREENSHAKYAINENGDALQETKWYSHEDDIKSFSLKHPKTLFCLQGEGEDSEDQWYKYFKNGKMQVCKAVITFEQYNENLLK